MQAVVFVLSNVVCVAQIRFHFEVGRSNDLLKIAFEKIVKQF